MSNPPKHSPSASSKGEDQIDALLKRVGPRHRPSPEVEAEVYSAVEQTWLTATRERSRTRWLAAVAALVVVFGSYLGLSRLVETPASASVVWADGVVEIERDGAWAPVADGASLRVGDDVRTGDGGRLIVRLSGGSVLRTDARSQFRFVEQARIQQVAGQIYLETTNTTDRVVIETPYGEVEHLGTRFSVSTDNERLVVRVREGDVRIRDDWGEFTAAAGHEATVSVQGVMATREIEAHGEAWQWLDGVPLPFRAEGRSLAEFLNWVEKESGYRVRYIDSVNRRNAGGVTLHGSIEGLSPREALDLIMPTTGFDYRFIDDVLEVGQGKPPQ